MQSGIITKDGIFIICENRGHLGLAYHHQTERQFIFCREQEGYGESVPMIDLVGDLNKKMLDGLFSFATSNNVIIEEVAGTDLEEGLLEFSKGKVK